MHLKTIEERLRNPTLSKLEAAQRHAFIEIVESLDVADGKALSVSCGDGIWDYLLISGRSDFKRVVACDIVDCPVTPDDQKSLKEQGVWEFERVAKDSVLPFEDECFDFVFHQDVVEHVDKPYLFLSEQYRILKKGGRILVGTPNLFRPGNIVKLLLGRLKFPVTIGSYEEIGDYVHVQEFYEEALDLLLAEVGFRDIHVRHCFFGMPSGRLCISMFPKRRLARRMSHYLTFVASK